MGKSVISTVFLGICAKLADFSPFFLAFCPIAPPTPGKLRPPMQTGSVPQQRHFRPKSTFLRGARAAAMGVFNASTIGAAN